MFDIVIKKLEIETAKHNITEVLKTFNDNDLITFCNVLLSGRLSGTRENLYDAVYNEMEYRGLLDYRRRGSK